jgi:hypothetical protein
MFHRFSLLALIALLSACSAGSDTIVNDPKKDDDNSLDEKQGPVATATWDSNFNLQGLNDTLTYLTVLDGKVHGFGTFDGTNNGTQLNGSFFLDTLTIKPLSKAPLQNGDSVHAFIAPTSDGSTMYGYAHYWHTNPTFLKYDGTTWSRPFSQDAFLLEHLAVAGGKLYGSYRLFSDSTIYMSYDAPFNISNAPFGVRAWVQTMAGFGRELYAATLDPYIDQNPVTEFDHFDGTNWSHMKGMSLPGKVLSIKKIGGQLYVIGDDGPRSRTFFVGHWTGSKWDVISGDMMGDMSERAVDLDVDKDGHYYAATTEEIFRWDGHAWTNLGLTSGGYIRTILIYKGMLIAGGNFYGIGTGPHVPSRCIGVYH